MSRFPFEEDHRFRFGSFYELVARYMFIGSEPATGPARARTTPPRPRPVEPARQMPLPELPTPPSRLPPEVAVVARDAVIAEARLRGAL